MAASSQVFQHEMPSSSEGPRTAYLDQWLAYVDQLAEWCSRNADRSRRRGQVEDALRWKTLVARTLATKSAPLASPELEADLLELAGALPRYEWKRSAPGAPKRWLHVMDQALPYGGHTAMARRWISSDTANIHSVALLSQQTPVPDTLAETVAASGGQVTVMDPEVSLLSRAGSLRKLAFENADYVVLHVAVWNVIAPVAFGLDGGPCVVLVNHAAHIFWVGVSVADLVLNCRGSELEREWTVTYRGTERSGVLPIPLVPVVRIPAGDVEQVRERAKRELEVPSGLTVLLTVGDTYKYRPLGVLNFFQAANQILSSCPNTYLLAVGPEPSEDWQVLGANFTGRVCVTGKQRDLRRYHAAADIYLEGFPFGSTTAFLEAGLQGIPSVLAPADCPPPFGTDGVALDHLIERPSSVRAYADQVVALVRDPARRRELGALLSQSIEHHHTGEGWKQYLAKVVSQLPASHSVALPTPQCPPRHPVHYWAEVVSTRPDFIGRAHGDILEYPFRLALENGLKPCIDTALAKACAAAKSVRQRAGAPLFVYVVIGLAAQVLPAPAALKLFSWLVPILRVNGLVDRWLRSILRSGERTEHQPAKTASTLRHESDAANVS